MGRFKFGGDYTVIAVCDVCSRNRNCLQLYPIGVIGSGLPIIMGVSFTFLGSLLVIATNPNLGYEGMVVQLFWVVFLKVLLD